MPNSISPGLGGAFARFWTGSLSSNLADGVMFTALPMAAAMLTEDPLLVSGLAVARFLPWLLTGLVAGVVVDRRDRVRLMAAANTVRGGALASVAAGAAVVLGVALAAPALRTLCRSADAAECEAVSGDREGSPHREPEEPDAAAG